MCKFPVVGLMMALLVAAPFTIAARAETAILEGGVTITKKTYDAPVNEQPFYGFARKSDAQRAADEGLREALDAKSISLDDAFKRAIVLGWQAIGRQDYATAAKRFNQAFLIRPVHPDLFQGFAVIVHVRFKDDEYAEELFRAGAGLDDRSSTYMADYGRLLLITRQPEKALKVLDEAVVDAPDFPAAWSNLAWARYHTGDPASACVALAEAEKLAPAESANIDRDMDMLRQAARCG